MRGKSQQAATQAVINFLCYQEHQRGDEAMAEVGIPQAQGMYAVSVSVHVF